MPCDATMDYLCELHRPAASQRFRDCLGTGKPNWPTVQPSETAPCCDLPRLEESILLLGRCPVLCPTEPRLVTAPAVLVRCPPNVHPAIRSRAQQNAIDQVNAGAESGDVDESFLPGQVSIAGFWLGDALRRGTRGTPDHFGRRGFLPAWPVHSSRVWSCPRSPVSRCH